MYVQHYSKLYATALNPEMHERTCGYWYTVTNGATAHTAFATRRGLDRWLEERGLTLDSPLPTEPGLWASTRVMGEYYEASHGTHVMTPCDECGGGYWHELGTYPVFIRHADECTRPDTQHVMIEDEEWGKLSPVIITADMSNGRYTLALITEEAGVRTVHTLNPNVKTRLEVSREAGYSAMRKLLN